MNTQELLSKKREIDFRFKSRFELETEFGVIDGTYEELLAEKEKFPGSTIHEVIPSIINKVKVSRVSYVTLGEYINIRRLFDAKKSIADIAALYHLRFSTCRKIIYDEFNVLLH
jgi:hypothetical protein